MFTCIYLREMDMVAYFWTTWDNKWEFIEFIGGILWGKEGMWWGFPRTLNKGPNQNNLLLFCYETILSAASCILRGHKLCLNQHCPQKAVYWHSEVSWHKKFALFLMLSGRKWQRWGLRLRIYSVQTHEGRLLITDGNVESSDWEEASCF